MKPIILSGATGFLGSHILEALVFSGYPVIALKRSGSDTRRIDHLMQKAVIFDIDKEPLDAVFAGEEIQAVIHTACHYGRNGDSIAQILESNLMYGVQLLELAIRNHVPTFLNTDTLLPRELNSYSRSKKQFVDWLKVFAGEVRIINVRPDHIYGPGEDDARFIPWIISQLQSGAESIGLTAGEQLRDFVYIDDVVSAYLLLIERADELGAFSEYDIGSGELLSVRSFVESLRSVYAEHSALPCSRLDFGALPYRPGEPMSVTPNLDGLRGLGWSASTPLTVGLENTIRDRI